MRKRFDRSRRHGDQPDRHQSTEAKVLERAKLNGTEMKRCKDCGAQTSNDYLCDRCEREAHCVPHGSPNGRWGSGALAREGTAEKFPLERAS